MRRHLVNVPVEILLTLVLLGEGCTRNDCSAPVVAPAARIEAYGLILPPAPWVVSPLPSATTPITPS